jgi:hypothetical protein
LTLFYFYCKLYLYILEEWGENPLLARNCKGAEGFCRNRNFRGRRKTVPLKAAANSHWRMPGRLSGLDAPKSGDFNIHPSHRDGGFSGSARRGGLENKSFFLVQVGYVRICQGQ